MGDFYDAIYTRQSVYKEESLSIETQIDYAKTACTREIRYYNDPGCSGKDIKRKDYLRLMQDVEDGKIKRVVVYRLDRFSRSLLDFAKAWETLNRYNVDFVSVNENFDSSSPIGEAMIFVIMIFAQLERKQIVARVTDNYYKRASLGWWPAGNGPYGYENVKMDIDDRLANSLVIVPDKMKLILWIYQKYAEPLETLSTIKKILNDSEMPSPLGRTWGSMAIKRVLSTLTYVKMDLYVYEYLKNQGMEITSDMSQFTGEFGGLVVGRQGGRKGKDNYKVSVGNWEGSIDSSLWIYCQEKLKRNRIKGRSGSGNKTWLPPLKCGYCNYGLTCVFYERQGRLIKKLYCSGRHMDACRRKINFEGNEIELEIEKQIEDVQKKHADAELETQSVPSFDEQKELLEIREKISNLIAVLSSSLVDTATITYINREIGKLEERKEELERENRKFVRASTYVVPKLRFADLTLEEKKKTAASYINKIYIYEDSIKVQWKI